MTEINNLTEFSELIKKGKPVLIDFYADWCGPCQSLLPIITELAEENKEDIEIVKVNVDLNPELSQKFQVRSIPALFFLKDGEVVDRIQGLQQKSVLQKKITALKAA
jgi:thioredoxin 1